MAPPVLLSGNEFTREGPENVKLDHWQNLSETKPVLQEDFRVVFYAIPRN
jgi:hypothetical protein